MKSRTLLFSLMFSVCLLGCQSSSQKNDNENAKESNQIASQNHPPLHLVLALDGVGYETIKKLYSGGYFRKFYQPSPMVASFPSLSDNNWSRILNAPLGESYTKSYFDLNHRDSNGVGKPKGSLINHITETPMYEKGFDFKAEGALEHFATMTWTTTSAVYWLDSLKKKFLSTRDKNYFYAFILNTDIIAHTQGEKPLLEYLALLDDWILKLRAETYMQYGYELQITMISDHGNYFVIPKPIEFQEPLEKKGWKLSETLKNPNDIAIVVPEIIAVGSFFCDSKATEKLARDLVDVDGVHVSAYVKSENVIRVIGKVGQVEISVSPKEKLVKYRTVTGQDILKQEEFFKNKSLSFNEYFSVSQNSKYPYSAVRLWEAFYANSIQVPSVIVSPELGRVFANPTLKMITMIKGLRSTHGSLDRIETFGMFMSTEDSYPPIRPDDFRMYIPLKEYQENLKTWLPH